MFSLDRPAAFDEVKKLAFLAGAIQRNRIRRGDDVESSGMIVHTVVVKRTHARILERRLGLSHGRSGTRRNVARIWWQGGEEVFNAGEMVIL